jgi:hypothetical protein
MDESKLSHGVVSKGKIKRAIRRATRAKLLPTAGAAPFNWQPIVLPSLTIKNQFNSSSCGGQAGSYWLEIVDRRLDHTDIQFSAKSIYAPIAYPQGGTTVYALEQQINKLGANFESDVPSYYPDTTTDEKFMIDKSYQTSELANKALRDAFRVSVSVPIDIESMAQAIQNSGGVIIEVQGQNNGTWYSATPKPPIKGNGEIWAHFVNGSSAGLLNGQKALAFSNSWGTQAGQGGWQYFTEEYINSGYIVDCFTWYPLGVTTHGNLDSTNWLWNLYQRFLHSFLT